MGILDDFIEDDDFYDINDNNDMLDDDKKPLPGFHRDSGVNGTWFSLPK